MSDDDDDLFADSDDDEVESPPKKKPSVAAKPKPAAKASSKPARKKAADDDDDELFDSDDDDDDDDDDSKKDDKSKDKKAAPAKKKAPALSRRERLEALAKKKRSDDTGGKSDKESKRSSKGKEKDASGSANKKKNENGYESEDSVDSANFQRTQEDDDFIDTTGEDDEAVAELYATQHFDDERGMAEVEKTKKRKISDRDGGGGGGRGEAVELDENGVPLNPIMAAVHKMKRKKKEKRSLEEVEDEVRTFLGRMDHAAEEDEQAIAERRPAMAKLQILAQVEEMLARRDMQRHLLDLDVLSVCKRWIQPLPNGKLGNVTVRQRILTAIAQMNNAGSDNGISAEDLRRSALGKVVMILFKHPDEVQSVKRMARNLIEQWSRPIFQKSGNMRDLERAGARQGTGLAAIKRRADVQQQMYDRQEMERKQVDNGKHANLQSLIATGRMGNAEMSASVNRVRVPYSKGFAYSVRPMNKTDSAASPMKRGVGGGAAADNRGKLAKRMVEKGRSVNKNQRSANISVEGRVTKG